MVSPQFALLIPGPHSGERAVSSRVHYRLLTSHPYNCCHPHTSQPARWVPVGLLHSGFHLPHSAEGNHWPHLNLCPHICCLSRLQGWIHLVLALAKHRGCHWRSLHRQMQYRLSLAKMKTAPSTLTAYSVNVSPEVPVWPFGGCLSTQCFVSVVHKSELQKTPSSLLGPGWLNHT